MIRSSHMGSERIRLPRVGAPHRTKKEEDNRELDKIEKYQRAVRSAGAEPVPISLGLSTDELKGLAETLDGFLLTGSPADVDPALYHQTRIPECNEIDAERERTDFALLKHAFAESKPVLAICYGIQSLNVFLSGSLLQDISNELHTKIRHDWDDEAGESEPFHGVRIERDSRLERLAGVAEAVVNSSHHQSVLEPGKNLRVVARAVDGVIEAIEWTGDSNWVVGVQWHPERMVETDPLARALFGEFVAAARRREVTVKA
jgi:putative glutamine amidotransferase